MAYLGGLQSSKRKGIKTKQMKMEVARKKNVTIECSQPRRPTTEVM